MMRLERAGEKQIHIFLSINELEQYGLSPNGDIWSVEWEHFLIDLISNIKDDLKIFRSETISIDIEIVQKQDEVFVMTIKSEEEDDFESDWDELDDGMDDIHFCFEDVENIIQLANRLYPDYSEGDLFFYEGRYHFIFPVRCQDEYEKLEAIFTEYGEPAIQTMAQMYSRGKKLIGGRAVSQLNRYFHKM
ncbi:adaptor protein MecA [Fervidibacillus halotolerans]|uniref:Adaptor protein MecA n=1 Tax=Fervidibacillus halotolerans TaxID=2980027 RepID=A0A9E8RZW1_9BACI|nr:adaptor protein MecA [Fervidibacillus halotolerans]WAA13788.1 adaptor protein MecA [Fervidibacillus halotolerans]